MLGGLYRERPPSCPWPPEDDAPSRRGRRRCVPDAARGSPAAGGCTGRIRLPRITRGNFGHTERGRRAELKRWRRRSSVRTHVHFDGGRGCNAFQCLSESRNGLPRQRWRADHAVRRSWRARHSPTAYGPMLMAPCLWPPCLWLPAYGPPAYGPLIRSRIAFLSPIVDIFAKIKLS